jgi:RHS repeat-associated protein
VVGLVDASGNVVARYQYGPYGSVTSSGPEADTNPWQYASSFLDGAFGLEKVGSRYYDAALARFTQVSPFMLDNIMLTSGSDECVYVHDDPVNLVDVTGLCSTTALTAEAVWTAFDTGFWLALVLSPETGGLSLFAYLALAGLPAVNWAGLGVEVSSCFG